jgi:hypothetical protein
MRLHHFCYTALHCELHCGDAARQSAPCIGHHNRVSAAALSPSQHRIQQRVERIGLSGVARHRQGSSPTPPDLVGHRLQGRVAPRMQRDGRALTRKRQRNSPPDAGTGPGDNRCLTFKGVHAALFLSPLCGTVSFERAVR